MAHKAKVKKARVELTTKRRYEESDSRVIDTTADIYVDMEPMDKLLPAHSFDTSNTGQAMDRELYTPPRHLVDTLPTAIHEHHTTEPMPGIFYSDWVNSMVKASEPGLRLLDAYPASGEWPSFPPSYNSNHSRSITHPLPPPAPPPPSSSGHAPPPPPSSGHTRATTAPTTEQRPLKEIIGMISDRDVRGTRRYFRPSSSTIFESSAQVTYPYTPSPPRTLVMDQLPKQRRTHKFMRSWSTGACGSPPLFTAIDSTTAKALIEFPDAESATRAWGSPRLGSGSQVKGKTREDLIRVWWLAEGVQFGQELEEGEIDDPTAVAAAAGASAASPKKEQKAEKKRQAQLEKAKLEKAKAEKAKLERQNLLAAKEKAAAIKQVASSSKLTSTGTSVAGHAPHQLPSAYQQLPYFPAEPPLQPFGDNFLFAGSSVMGTDYPPYGEFLGFGPAQHLPWPMPNFPPPLPMPPPAPVQPPPSRAPLPPQAYLAPQWQDADRTSGSTSREAPTRNKTALEPQSDLASQWRQGDWPSRATSLEIIARDNARHDRSREWSQQDDSGDVSVASSRPASPPQSTFVEDFYSIASVDCDMDDPQDIEFDADVDMELSTPATLSFPLISPPEPLVVSALPNVSPRHSLPSPSSPAPEMPLSTPVPSPAKPPGTIKPQSSRVSSSLPTPTPTPPTPEPQRKRVELSPALRSPPQAIVTPSLQSVPSELRDIRFTPIQTQAQSNFSARRASASQLVESMDRPTTSRLENEDRNGSQPETSTFNEKIQTPTPVLSTPIPATPSPAPAEAADTDRVDRLAKEEHLRRLVLASKRRKLAVPTSETPSPSNVRLQAPTHVSDAPVPPPHVIAQPVEDRVPIHLEVAISPLVPANPTANPVQSSFDDLAVSFITETIKTLTPAASGGPVASASTLTPNAMQKPTSSRANSVMQELAAKHKSLQEQIARSKMLMTQLGQARTKQEKDTIMALLRRPHGCVFIFRLYLRIREFRRG